MYCIGADTPSVISTTAGENVPPYGLVESDTSERNPESGILFSSTTRTVTGIASHPTRGVPTRETIIRAFSKTLRSSSDRTEPSMTAESLTVPPTSDHTVRGISDSVASI